MWLLLVAASRLDSPENYPSPSSLSQTTRGLRFSSAPIFNWMMFFFVFVFFLVRPLSCPRPRSECGWGGGGSVGGVFWGLGEALADAAFVHVRVWWCELKALSHLISYGLSGWDFCLQYRPSPDPPPSVRVRSFALSESFSVRIESLVVFFVSSLQCGGRLARDLSGEKKKAGALMWFSLRHAGLPVDTDLNNFERAECSFHTVNVFSLFYCK